jgi:peptidoglycan/xylan/chitin deacetylase (PgdA/CDA1 family)
MTDPLYDEPRYLTELPEDLKLKRAEAARRRRWRRRLTLGALIAVVGAVVAVVVTAVGGGEESGRPRSEAQQTQSQPATSTPTTTPSARADWKPHPGPVPILSYGAIQSPSPAESFPELLVEPRDFEAQLTWLDEQGFEAATLAQVERAWYQDGKLPPKPIVITFDNGYASQYANAFPVLQEHDWPGVLNLQAQGAELPDGDVRKLVDAGWELASRATDEVDLTAVDSAALETEVAGSRRDLRERFGVPVRNFSYPSGSYDETVISAVAKAGYEGAQTQIPGIADAAHPYILDRIQILLSDGVAGLRSKLRSVGALG